LFRGTAIDWPWVARDARRELDKPFAVGAG